MQESGANQYLQPRLATNGIIGAEKLEKMMCGIQFFQSRQILGKQKRKGNQLVALNY
jgi:hypothetical protein